MKLAVLPGDDIGPEIVAAALDVLSTADKVFGLGIDYDVHEVGMAAHRRLGTTPPDTAMAGVLAADGVLLGPGGMTAYPPLSEGGVNIPGTIRKRLELFANIRPARSRRNVPRAHPGLDCVLVRENTEGFYADRNLHQGYGEFMPTPDVAMSMRLITAKASKRIAERAFEIAARLPQACHVRGQAPCAANNRRLVLARSRGGCSTTTPTSSFARSTSMPWLPTSIRARKRST